MLHAMLLLLLAAAAGGQPPLRVERSIDLARYSGKWYEVARLPNGSQSRCASDVVAYYTTRADGGMTVVNQCRKSDGGITEARGMARKAGDRKNNATLQVRFAPAILSFLPSVWGDYWIIGLGPDYTWAVVGHAEPRVSLDPLAYAVDEPVGLRTGARNREGKRVRHDGAAEDPARAALTDATAQRACASTPTGQLTPVPPSPQ